MVTFLWAPTLLPKQAEKLPLRERGVALVCYSTLVVLDFTQINTPKGCCGNLNTPYPTSPWLIRLFSSQGYLLISRDLSGVHEDSSSQDFANIDLTSSSTVGVVGGNILKDLCYFSL